MPGDLLFLNSFRVLRHSSSETMPPHHNFPSSFKEVMFQVSKKVSLGCARITFVICKVFRRTFFLAKNFKLVGCILVIIDLQVCYNFSTIDPFFEIKKILCIVFALLLLPSSTSEGCSFCL